MMSLTEKLTSIKTKLTSVLSDINTALVAKGATEVTSLAEVPTAIESVQGEGDEVDLIEDYEANYTRPSWWLPYPELTEGDNINEIFLLMEVDPDVMEYDGIDLTDTPILRNGKKQFWQRIEGTQVEETILDVVEIYANCSQEWSCYTANPLTVITTPPLGTAVLPKTARYPKLQIISGSPMRLSSTNNQLAWVGTLRLVNCPVYCDMSMPTAFSCTGLIRAPKMYSSAGSFNFLFCGAITDGGVIGGEYCKNIILNQSPNLLKIHLSEPCYITATNFSGCLALKYVTVDKDFKSSIYIHQSTQYTAEILHAIIENYADCTAMSTPPTFQIGSVNIAKIDDEHKAMLETKGILYQ